MTDNVAVLDGYILEIHASSFKQDLFLLVKPDTDLNDTFKAWDMDNQEYIRVDGWNFQIDVKEN